MIDCTHVASKGPFKLTYLSLQFALQCCLIKLVQHVRTTSAGHQFRATLLDTFEHSVWYRLPGFDIIQSFHSTLFLIRSVTVIYSRYEAHVFTVT